MTSVRIQKVTVGVPLGNNKTNTTVKCCSLYKSCRWGLRQSVQQLSKICSRAVNGWVHLPI